MKHYDLSVRSNEVLYKDQAFELRAPAAQRYTGVAHTHLNFREDLYRTMVPYVVALLMLVTASDARQGNKQFLRPQSKLYTSIKRTAVALWTCLLCIHCIDEAPLLNGDITHIKGEYVVVLKAKVDGINLGIDR